jgi:hypothetical protein
MGRLVRYASLAGLFAFALMVGPSVSDANPFFARQTGQPCVACHQPGQEQRGASGLNSTGLAFKDCGETPGCFGAPAAPQSFVKSTATQGGSATFTHKGCHHQARYVTIMLGGSVPVSFVLDRGMEVHVVVAQNSTFAARCGGYPGSGANYRIITLD